jgi:hypothetical protein
VLLNFLCRCHLDIWHTLHGATTRVLMTPPPIHFLSKKCAMRRRRNVLYISRFTDATLHWAAEGVEVTMSHDYLRLPNSARVDLLLQTLEQPFWEGTIQVRAVQRPCATNDLTISVVSSPYWRASAPS